MNYVDYKDLADSLKTIKSEMEKELAEVRAAKLQLIEMQRTYQEMVFNGRYERDDDTIIISAPNIIIGNVDKMGNMLDGPSNITLRGNNVAFEGVGYGSGAGVSGGSVTTRARNVNIQTVDPGIDGMESVAFPDSAFSVQSAAIALNAEVIDNSASGGVFTSAAQPVMGCINLSAEANINVSAACAIEDKNLNTVASNLEKSAKDSGKSADNAINLVEEHSKALDKNQNNAMLDLLGAADEEADILALRTGMYEFEDRSEKTEIAVHAITDNLMASVISMSMMAEDYRIAKYLKARSKRLSSQKSDYATKPTGSSVNINSEVISMNTIGADGKVRTSPGNGFKVNTQNTAFTTFAEKLKPIERSSFSVTANTINIDASDYTYVEKDNKLQLSKSEAKGVMYFNAGKIEMTTQDREFEAKGDALSLKDVKLTPESYIWFNTGDAYIDLCDGEGKAQGTMAVNAKNISLTSYDCEKETHLKPTAVAEGGKISMGAKEVYIGTTVKDQNCDMIQLDGKQVNILGDEKVNLQQAKDKSHLLLDDNAELSGKDVKVIGKITLGGKTEVKDKFTAGDIEAKNGKFSSSIYGPNLKDGTPIPGAGAPPQPGKGAQLKNIESVQSKKKKKQ